MRHRRKNPGAGLIIVGVAAVAAVGSLLAFVLRSKVEQTPAINPNFTGLPASQVATFPVGFCITAVNGANGFKVNGIALGENVLLEITEASGGGGSVLAVPRDPRLPPGLPPMEVPASSISGGGDCT